MLTVIYSTQFKIDYKRCQKRGLNINLLKNIIATLAIPQTLPDKNRDHSLTGQYKGRRECHTERDWL